MSNKECNRFFCQVLYPSSCVYRRWNSEPNNFAGNEDCAQVLQDGVFNDMSCLSKQGYICEVHLEGKTWYS
jgi:hypothetical protein